MPTVRMESESYLANTSLESTLIRINPVSETLYHLASSPEFITVSTDDELKHLKDGDSCLIEIKMAGIVGVDAIYKEICNMIK